VKDFVSHHLLFLIGWKDLQIVRQLMGTMTNAAAPTSLLRHQKQANPLLSLGYCTQQVISTTDKIKLQTL
jgi:hypothetical protein